MGREFTDVHTDKKPNGMIHNVSKLRIHVAPKISSDEAKDYEVKEWTEEHSPHKPDVLSVKSTNFEVGSHDVNDEKSGSQKSSPAAVKTAAARNGDVNSSENGNTVHSPSDSKNSQPNSPGATLKVFQADKKHTDEEDNWSLSSSTAASVRTNKSHVTVGSAPKFRSAERAQRRKQFYTKLEEKQKALEEERLQCEQRLKEEQEAALKQLRKSMIIKANPVPSFYYEAPPPKRELKKLPLTRPKSPKLNRRKSCSDATHSPQEEKPKFTQAGRRSLGSFKVASSPSSSSGGKAKSQIGGRSGSRSFKAKDQPLYEEEIVEAAASNLSEQSNDDATIQS